MEVPGEREPPLYFAGRKEELGVFDSKLRRLCSTGDPSGGLQLVVGVPGVGKTQLALAFAKSVEGTDLLGSEVATARLPAEALNSPVDLFKSMGFALDQQSQANQVAQHDDRVSGATVGALGARGALALDIARHTPDLYGLLQESKRAGMWQGKALVLMFDELQVVQAAGMDALRVLHGGLHGCPILLMGFGLQHTERTLANPRDGRGISRVATPTTLSSLDADDALDAFAGNLSCLGHDDVAEDSLMALAEASFGFPQHINGYLEGAHEALLRHGQLDGAALDAALRHGHDRRATYYNKRLAASNGHESMSVVSAAMESAGATAITCREAMAALKSAGFGQGDLDAAIAHGALVHGDDGLVSFGIPSFHDHMAAVRERHRRRPLADRAG